MPYLAEQDIGEHRIYAAAIPAPRHRYFAGVVVKRVCGPGARREEKFRDEQLGCARSWQQPEDALAFAIATGVRVALSMMTGAPMSVPARDLGRRTNASVSHVSRPNLQR